MDKMCECGLVEFNECRCAEYEGVVDPFDTPPWELPDDEEIDWGETGEDYPLPDDGFDWEDDDTSDTEGV